MAKESEGAGKGMSSSRSSPGLIGNTSVTATAKTSSSISISTVKATSSVSLEVFFKIITTIDLFCSVETICALRLIEWEENVLFSSVISAKI